jgi:hypothetical protein
MPAMMATPPAAWTGPTGLPKRTMPAVAPTSGSMLTKAPAISAATRLWPKAKSVKGSSVPPSARATVARTGPAPCGAAGIPSATAEKGSTATAAPRNCTAVTAIGSRPRSRRTCPTVNVADSSSDASTSPSPPSEAPPPLPAATRPTPASETANPAQATGRATLCCHRAAMTATSTGTAPISRAAWVTLVRPMPEFCKMTEPP